MEKLEEFIKLKKDLEANIGKERLEIITNGITTIIEANNLDVTPQTLQDVFKYVRALVVMSNL